MAKHRENSDDLKNIELIQELEGLSETQRRILEASIYVFAKRGFEGGRIDEIAKRAGVNKAMIYYYFRSKEDLFTTIIETVFERVSTIIGEHVYKINTDTFYEDISTFIDRYVDLIYRNRIVLNIIVWEIARGGEIISRVVKEKIGIHFQKIIETFPEAMDAGIIRTMDPRHLFFNIIAMILFYFFANRVVSTVWEEDALSPENVEKRKREVTDFVIHAIMPEKVSRIHDKT